MAICRGYTPRPVSATNLCVQKFRCRIVRRTSATLRLSLVSRTSLKQTDSAWRLRTLRVDQFRVPPISALRCEIEHVVDGSQRIDPAFFHVLGHPGVRGVHVMRTSTAIAREDGDA